MSFSKKTEQQWDRVALGELFENISLLNQADEFADFFEDLCTPAELRSMADRWRVAKRLDRGESYRTISDETGVSTTTITRVARSMTYGTMGYSRLLQRIKTDKNTSD